MLAMDSQVTATSRPQLPQSSDDRSESTFQEVLELIKIVLSIRRERHALRTISDEALADIGIERDAALKESRRSLFDLPPGRL
jgi:uncharacterized protein YjiS (DUF1127 family)